MDEATQIKGYMTSLGRLCVFLLALWAAGCVIELDMRLEDHLEAHRQRVLLDQAPGGYHAQ
jgi:hypothetical protein